MTYLSNGMDPRAQKRFDNDRTRAAANSLATQAARLSAPKPNVQQNNARQPVAPVENQQMPQQPVQSSMPVQQQPVNNQPVTQQPVRQQAPQELAMTIENNINLEKFLSSPEVQQSMARARLRQYFKRNDPNGGVQDVGLDALSHLLQ